MVVMQKDGILKIVNLNSYFQMRLPQVIAVTIMHINFLSY